MSSRNDSSAIWVSTKRKDVALSSTPTWRYRRLISEPEEGRRKRGQEEVRRVPHRPPWLPAVVTTGSQASDLSRQPQSPLVQKPSRTFSELLLSVMFADLDLEGDVLTDGGGQAGQTLAPAAPAAHQEHVAPRLSDDAHDPCDWGAGDQGSEVEEHPRGTPGP